jgi:hypothetical protein
VVLKTLSLLKAPLRRYCGGPYDTTAQEGSPHGPERLQTDKALFGCFKVSKILQDFSSHRIFKRMYKALNIGKK